MARYYGAIGYATTIESSPGVFKEEIVERMYRGDVIRNARRLEKGEGINDNVNINNSISIVADPYANENFFAIRYASWMGAKWKVTNIEVERPRLILTIGGLWNGSEED